MHVLRLARVAVLRQSGRARIAFRRGREGAGGGMQPRNLVQDVAEDLRRLTVKDEGGGAGVAREWHTVHYTADAV